MSGRLLTLSGSESASADTPDTAVEPISPRDLWERRGWLALIALPDRIVSSALVAAVPVGLAVVFHVFLPAIVLPAIVVAVVGLWRFTPSRFLQSDRRKAWWSGATPGTSDAAGTGSGPAGSRNAADSAQPGTRTVQPGTRTGRPGVRTAQAVAQRSDRARGSGAAIRDGLPGARERAAIGAALALALMLLWLLLNRRYISGYVVLERDPAIYTLRALWLSSHSSPIIDSGFEAFHAGAVPGVQIDSLAFPAVGGSLYPQSYSLLPGVLGVAGWFHGLRGILIGNLLIGGVALLSVYGFGRRLLGPIWALLPMVALAASMPMVAFSRGSFSEPIALAATFGCLTVLWSAWQTGSLMQFFTAGLLVGVSSLARIDGGLTLIGMLAGFGVVTLAARSRQVRRRAVLATTAWAVGAGVLDAISQLDGAWNSPVYQSSEWHGLLPLLLGTVAAYLVVIGVAVLPVDRLRTALGAGAPRWARLTFAVAVLIGIGMISRPLWWTSHQNISAFVTPLANMQQGLGLPVDGLHTYDETSVSWQAMYIGWPAVLLGALGAAMLLGRTVRRRDPRIAAFAATVACVGVLYLNKISIFPDQIWAMRRFLPVILPGLLIAAVYPLVRLLRRRPALSWFVAVLAVVVGGGPLVVWGPVWSVANAAGQPQEMSTACQLLDGHPVILAGPEAGSAHFLPTIKIGCKLPVVSYLKPTAQGLLQLRSRLVDPVSGKEPWVMAFAPDAVAWSGAAPPPVITTTLAKWEQPLQRAPFNGLTYQRSIFLGTITPAGLVQGFNRAPVKIGG